MTELSEDEYLILFQALQKCIILKRAVKAGLPVTLTDKNFGFAEMTLDEEEQLSDKLLDLSKVAWLQEQKK